MLTKLFWDLSQITMQLFSKRTQTSSALGTIRDRLMMKNYRIFYENTDSILR